MTDIRFRWATADDFAALGQVLFDAVRLGPSPYTEAQRRAWVPEPRGGAGWIDRLAPQHIAIAETDGAIAGFMSLAERGYVDLAFIRPAHRGSGLFAALYQRIEDKARQRGEARLSVHASLAARPAFLRQGFVVTAEEEVESHGERLARFTMEKALRAGEAA
jgi:putative acetyltransferase